jgi:hypothetical protein
MNDYVCYAKVEILKLIQIKFPQGLPQNCYLKLMIDKNGYHIHSRMILCQHLGFGLSDSFHSKSPSEIYLMPEIRKNDYWGKFQMFTEVGSFCG